MLSKQISGLGVDEVILRGTFGIKGEGVLRADWLRRQLFPDFGGLETKANAKAIEEVKLSKSFFPFSFRRT